MKREVENRVRAVAEYVMHTGATVRACAGRFGVSKTTIHKDLRERLPELDRSLAGCADAVLNRNREQRHLRGGEATREKYRRRREKSLKG